MDNAKKARAVGFNHVALEVGDIAEALAFYRRLFDFELRARALVRPSSIWATNSLRFRKAVPNLLTVGAILDSWSTTRMPSATG
jgi:catechol 2,3-dioxygenase-like lactoylglutathione lyase family enzyme